MSLEQVVVSSLSFVRIMSSCVKSRVCWPEHLRGCLVEPTLMLATEQRERVERPRFSVPGSHSMIGTLYDVAMLIHPHSRAHCCRRAGRPFWQVILYDSLYIVSVPIIVMHELHSFHFSVVRLFLCLFVHATLAWYECT